MLLPTPTALDFEAALASFAEYGFARLGRLIEGEMLAKLRTRADEIMQGRVADPGFFYQHDAPSGRYEDLEYGQGWRGPSLAYRKIEKMERDPLFRAWIGNPIFERIAMSTIGEGATIYRAVLWNKAADGGTNLPWHQDDGAFWGIDRSPSLQIWTALDAAPAEAGCLEVLPRSHLAGLATPDGGTVPQDLVATRCRPEATIRLAAQAGESFLLHNHTWHRSGRNETPRARRALSISFLSADTRCTRRRRAPREFVKAF